MRSRLELRGRSHTGRTEIRNNIYIYIKDNVEALHLAAHQDTRKNTGYTDMKRNNLFVQTVVDWFFGLVLTQTYTSWP